MQLCGLAAVRGRAMGANKVDHVAKNWRAPSLRRRYVACGGIQ